MCWYGTLLKCRDREGQRTCVLQGGNLCRRASEYTRGSRQGAAACTVRSASSVGTPRLLGRTATADLMPAEC
jgi:hypothetical protein